MAYVQDTTVPRSWFFLTGSINVSTQTTSVLQPPTVGSQIQQIAAGVYSSTTTAADGTGKVVNDNVNGAAWSVNQWRGFLVKMTSGSSAGQVRWIKSNAANSLTISGGLTEPLLVTGNGDGYQILSPGDHFPVVTSFLVSSADVAATTKTVTFNATGWASGATAVTTRLLHLLTYDTNANKMQQVVPMSNLQWRGIRSGGLEIVASAACVGNYTIEGYWLHNNLPQYTGGPNS